MATPNVSDSPLSTETRETLELFVQASDEIAASLNVIRERWWNRERSVAMLVEGLRIQFNGFAGAGTAGRVTDLTTLRTIGRLYENIAITVYELSESTQEGERLDRRLYHRRALDGELARQARELLARASGLAALVSDLIETGPRPVVAGVTSSGSTESN